MRVGGIKRHLQIKGVRESLEVLRIFGGKITIHLNLNPNSR